MQSVQSAPNDNVFCAGHSWDAAGDLIAADGDRKPTSTFLLRVPSLARFVHIP